MVMHRELEVTVVSAHNLRNVNKLGFGTMSPYAVLWIDSNSKASTHVAEHGGTNPSWNCVIRMLCRETLFGTAAKAKLMIEVFDKSRNSLAGMADVLVSELLAGDQSSPKRMALDIRRFRKGSNFDEKVIGSIDIQVRLARAAKNEADDLNPIDRAVTVYNGVPIDHNLVIAHDFHTFNVHVPAPIVASGQAAPVYYQHVYVEKPKVAWRGICDTRNDGRLGVLAMGALGF